MLQTSSKHIQNYLKKEKIEMLCNGHNRTTHQLQEKIVDDNSVNDLEARGNLHGRHELASMFW